ncbi:TetR/AcrR family transcriptional regulator [Chloroflexota bacterium]
MDGFERRKERKKGSIRQAALELFSKYGFKKVSLNDIAHKANVSHVTIYNHFGSKEELVQDVIKTEISALVERARTIIKGDKPFLEKLELIIFNKAELASQYQGQMMRVVIMDNPEMQQFIQSVWQQEVNQLITDLVDEGKRLGYVNKELSQEAVFYYFEIIRRGSLTSIDLLANIKVDAKLARDLNYLFLYGLVDKKEQKQ